MPNVLFSIIIPTKDPNISLLQEALDSIRSQTFPPAEILLVCYFTDPEEAKIVKKAVGNDVKILTSEEASPSIQRNIGIAEATGNYIVFLDDDDLLNKQFLQACAKAVEAEHPDLICFHYTTNPEFTHNDLTDFQTIQGREKVLNVFSRIRSPNKPTDIRCVWAKAFSAKTLRAHNVLFNKKLFMAEDMTFCLEFAIHSKKMVCFSNPGEYGYYYRQREGSASYKFDPMACEKIKVFLSEYSKILVQYKLPFEDFYYHICNQSIYNIALSYIFHKEHKIKFHKKAALFRKLMQGDPYASAISRTRLSWMSTNRKKVLLLMLKMHCFFVASVLLNARYGR